MWGVARAHGGEVLLRVEDHDRHRSRKDFEGALLDDLDWLGFAPDIGRTNEFRAGELHLRQSDNRARYEQVLGELEQTGLVYACACSRRDIAEVAGNSFGAELPYPGTCRNANVDGSKNKARRLRLKTVTESFHDLRCGLQLQIPANQCGDMLIRDRFGQFTYQFGVTIDDFDQNIDVIIRGEDLLASTGRQLQLARMIGRTRPPQFLHHALVRRADGLKLSKSLGDTSVREMRDAGMNANDVIGRAAFDAGLISERGPVSQDMLAELFT